MRYFGLAALCAIAIAGALCNVGCTAQQEVPAGSRPNTSRDEAAKFTATGVIAAAAAREPADDPADYYGRALSISEREALLAAVPRTLGADPLLYETRFVADSGRSDSVTAVVSLPSSPASPVLNVAMVWDPTALRSVWSDGRNVDLSGNWIVTSVSAESSLATIADAYPAARNTAQDIDAARLVAVGAVRDDITAGMLRHSAVRDEIPVDWWDTHDQEPFQVANFTAQSPADRARGGNWTHTYILVKERSDSSWVLFRQDEGS